LLVDPYAYELTRSLHDISDYEKHVLLGNNNLNSASVAPKSVVRFLDKNELSEKFPYLYRKPHIDWGKTHIYELHVGNYSALHLDVSPADRGRLAAIGNTVDYLKSLSIDTIWLTPFLECNSYHGYDTVDYFKVDPRFGTNDDFQELIFKAHENDMKILMDLVINHASTAGDLFKKAQRAEKGTDLYGNEFEYRNMFHFLMEGQKTQTGDLVENDPDWHHDGESKYYYYAKFGDNMPDFNYD
jgi:glycosidase